MMHLIRAELLKLTRQRVTLVLFGFFLGLGPVCAVLFACWILFGSAGDRANAIDLMQYPHTLASASWAVERVGALVGIIFAAGPLLSEFRHGAWDLLLPRSRSRVRPLVAKLVVAAVTLAVVAIACVGAWIASAYVALLLFGERAATPEIVATMPMYAPWPSVMTIAVAALDTAFDVALVWCVVLATRSQVAGFAAGILFPTFSWFVKGRMTAIYLPETHLANVTARFVPVPELLQQVQLDTDRVIPGWASVAVLLAYAAALVAVGVVVHARRDFKAR